MCRNCFIDRVYIMELFYQSEKGRGIVSYILAIIIANSLNIILTRYTSLTIEQSTFISMYLIGSLMVYSGDILIAKDAFYFKEYGKVVTVPHRDILTRGRWLIGSFVDKYFMRFIITVIIDTLIGLALLRYAIKTADNLEILPNWKYRNHLIVFIIAIFTYILYLSTLRFDWAYVHKEDMMLNILMIAWASLAILVYTSASPASTNIKWRNLY
jgi:hypothetical protein